MKSSNKPILPEALVALGVLACLSLTSCSRVVVDANSTPPEGVPVRAALAVTKDVPLEITAVGNVEAMKSVEVKPRTTGQIQRVAFQEGQNVTKGQLLFVIDPDALERQAAEEQAQLERDIAVEQQTRAIVARDAASQKQSRSEAEIAQKLGALGVLSGQRVNQMLTTSDTTQAALRSDEAAAAAATDTTKADRARLSQTQLQLSFTQVTAPISGRAGAVMVTAGNVARENDTTLVTLLQLAPVYVAFSIPEQELAEVQKLNAHDPLKVEAGSGEGATQEGSLAFINNAVDATTGTIQLRAVFPNTNEALWPGEFVHIRLRLAVENGKVVVPESSIQNGLDGKYTWVVRSGIATVTPVTISRTYQPEGSAEEAVVSSGIRAGEMVVTEGQLRLTPGARVSLLNTPRGASPHASAADDPSGE
nr:efflux RND transporter periplasmic adaptor subunit [Paracidobacterium acidisoli]